MPIVKQNGYVRWGPLVTLMSSVVIATLGGTAFMLSLHTEREAHAGAQKVFVRKSMFSEHCKLMEHYMAVNSEQHAEIRSDLKEIRKELKK